MYFRGCVRWLWGLGVYTFVCALTVSLLLSREHDRAHSGVLQQPTGLARMGGASAEADEGHVCEQPHHQAPLGAIAHSKALTVMACAGAVSGYRSSKPLPPASVGVTTEQTAPNFVSALNLSDALSYFRGFPLTPRSHQPCQ